MRDPTDTRLVKEARVLAPWYLLTLLAGLGALAYVRWVLPGVLTARGVFGLPPDMMRREMYGSAFRPIMTLVLVQTFVLYLASAVSFGTEFGHGAMGRLLAQPISRARIWVEKMTPLAVLAGVALVFVDLLYREFWARGGVYVRYGWGIPPYNNDILPDYGVRFVFLAGLLATSTAPWMALYLRQTHTIFWAAIVLPILVYSLANVGVEVAVHLWLPPYASTSPVLRWLVGCIYEKGSGFPITRFVAVWAPVAYVAGWRKFRRLEV